MSKTIGIQRDLTAFFRNARQEYKLQQQQFPVQFSENRGVTRLIDGIQPSHLPIHNKNSAHPPLWVDEYDKIGDQFNHLEQKGKLQQVNKLKQIQKERLQITFGDSTQKDHEINFYTQQITDVRYNQLIKECEGFIKSITNENSSKSDNEIRRSIKLQLANRLKELTLEHRISQRNFMEKLKLLNAGEEDAREVELYDQQGEDAFDYMDELDQGRNEGINCLVNNINELAMLFKDLSDMVLHQGTILDRIDYNIELASQHTHKGKLELIKAENYQKSMRGIYCMMFLITCIVLLALVLIWKEF